MRQAQHTQSTSCRAKRAGALILALGLGLFGSVTAGAAAYAAPPPALGVDGDTLYDVSPEMRNPDTNGPQGLLEPGANRDFFSSTWSGSNPNTQTKVFRYFEHPEGTTEVIEPQVFETNTEESGLWGKVHSLSTDDEGRLYTLHMVRPVITDPVSYLVTRWNPDGSHPESREVLMPDVALPLVTGIAVTGSGDEVTVSYRIDSPVDVDGNGIWRGPWGGELTHLNPGGLPPAENPEQSPFLEIGTLPDGREAVYFQIHPGVLGILIDGVVTTAAPLSASSVSDEEFAAQSANSGITWASGSEPRRPQMIQGVDAAQAAETGLIFVSAGWDVYQLDAETGQNPVVALSYEDTDEFLTYQSRQGTDGRTYLSGMGHESTQNSSWGALSVGRTLLASPTMSYGDGASLTANLCAVVPGQSTTLSVTEVSGAPEPSWFRVAGALPEQIALDAETGALTLTPTKLLPSTMLQVTAKNGVSQAAGSPSPIGTATVSVTKTPVAFGQTTVPKISGEAEPGETLTATVPAWTPVANLALQWFRDGKPLAGQTGATYAVTEQDQGTELTVSATGTADCRIQALTSSAAFLIPDATDPTPTPTPTEPTPKPTTSVPGGKTPVTPTKPGLAETGGDAVVWISGGALGIAAILAGAIILIGRFRKR